MLVLRKKQALYKAEHNFPKKTNRKEKLENVSNKNQFVCKLKTKESKGCLED